MIQLHPDCLMLQMASGESIPCCAELVTVELTGEGGDLLDPDLVRNSTRAVLHYFKVELGKSFVSVAEFSRALAGVLRGFGLNVTPADEGETPPSITESDLRRLACESGQGFELAFFGRIRDELRQQVNHSPHLVRFTGLRGCV